nr:hypothetical protein [Salinicola halophilus]
MSLVELMVSMVIGLMLVLMVTQYLIASRQSYQSSMANGEAQDARRFALNLVQHQLWLAGYSDDWSDFDVAFPTFESEDARVPSFEKAQLVASTGDDVWVRYRAPALADQPSNHCDGTVFSGEEGGANAIAMTRLYLDGDTLRCKVYFAGRDPNNSLPLLNDVDAVRWSFFDQDDRWKAPADVDWRSVRAIRLTAILASHEGSGERFEQQFDWGEKTLGFDDGRARALAEITTTLRNLPERSR